MRHSLLGVILCALPVSAGLAMADTTPADVMGTWQTEAKEQPAADGRMTYMTMSTTFTEDKQELIVSVYADPERQIKLFEYSSGGPWEQQGPAEGVDGAMAINLTNDYSLATIFVDAPDLWASVSLAECPMTVGEAVDITTCANGPPFMVTNCIDKDIVLVDEGGQRLRYGGGGVDRCVERPVELSTDVFMRVE